MQRAVIFVALLLGGCDFGYGPVREQSGFDSARLVDEGSVLFTFHDSAYQPAAGIRAFPDGGTPRYVRDRQVLARFDPRTGGITRLYTEQGGERWRHGSGALTVTHVSGTWALVGQGGQLADDSFSHRTALVDLIRNAVEWIDLDAELARAGRSAGWSWLLADGSIAVFGPALGEPKGAKNWSNDAAITPELYVRSRSGRLKRLARNINVEGTEGTALIWWTRDTRQFFRYDAATDATTPTGRWLREASTPARSAIARDDHLSIVDPSGAAVSGLCVLPTADVVRWLAATP